MAKQFIKQLNKTIGMKALKIKGMRKLYYVVEKELQNVDGFEETTGNKTVTTYSCGVDENGLPYIKREFDIELSNEDNSIEGIKDYLIDNGLEDEINEFEFIQL